MAAQPVIGNAGGGGDPRGGSGKMVLDIMKAGGLVVAGTDTPNAINLHGELMAYTMAGMSRLRCAEDRDRQSREGARLNAGTIEAGKLADLIVIDGDPLAEHRQHRRRSAAWSPTAGCTTVSDLGTGGPSPVTAGR